MKKKKKEKIGDGESKKKKHQTGKMKVGEKRRESERDFYLESFHSPLTSITPLDFHRLMGVKLRTDEETDRSEIRDSV